MKTAELTGAALDWAVDEAMGFGAQYLKWWIAGGDTRFTHCQIMRAYSAHWAEGGPIIEREGIELHGSMQDAGACWAQFYRMRPTFNGRYKSYHREEGATPLIAAMRCFVASKLGGEVDVPKELLP